MDDRSRRLEVVNRREHGSSSQSVSVRMARSVYYRPGTFGSRRMEWEETVHQDTGLLGYSTKHLYISGPKKKFQVQYDRNPGLRAVQRRALADAGRADDWFDYNLAVNLPQMQ